MILKLKVKLIGRLNKYMVLVKICTHRFYLRQTDSRHKGNKTGQEIDEYSNMKKINRWTDTLIYS